MVLGTLYRCKGKEIELETCRRGDAEKMHDTESVVAD